MELARFLLRPPSLFFLTLLACLVPGASWAEPTGPNIIPGGNFEAVEPTYVPWAGVDATNNIRGLEGEQIMVGDTGNIDTRAHFAPSVAVGDLNGDGKNDLVVADSRGFFWYYPNSGTPQKPNFTQAEVIPIWLGEERVVWNSEGFDHYVPRIQLVDFNDTKKLDVVAGTYAGKLFRVPNLGSTEQPNFHPTPDRDRLLVNTHKKGVLWCNYLAPFFTTGFNTNNLHDLIVGEGTYSANNIYLFRNTDTDDHPVFNEDHFKRIIPGMGLEQLTPSVVDWNNDGKPDILSGDRTGYINLFINNSTDPGNPTFAPGVHIKIAGQEQFGKAITVAVCDLSGNHLPNLVIGRDDGTILYAVNGGTPGNPVFNTPALPLKGALPPDYHYVRPTAWAKDQAYGVPYELVGVTNPQLEPGFKFPDGVVSKYALKFWVWPYTNQFFQRYYPPTETYFTEHVINGPEVTLKMNTHYLLHFWIMSPRESVSNFRFQLQDGAPPGRWAPPNIYGEAATSSTWTKVTKSIYLDNSPDPTVKEYGYGFQFRFQGQSTFYIDDVEIQEDR